MYQRIRMQKLDLQQNPNDMHLGTIALNKKKNDILMIYHVTMFCRLLLKLKSRFVIFNNHSTSSGMSQCSRTIGMNKPNCI